MAWPTGPSRGLVRHVHRSRDGDRALAPSRVGVTRARRGGAGPHRRLGGRVPGRWRADVGRVTPRWGHDRRPAREPGDDVQGHQRTNRGNDVIDTCIKGGTVIDGTGARRAEPTSASPTAGWSRWPSGSTRHRRGRSTPTDRIVCPGFVDLHTHYDVQAFWDPTLSPSPLHGVTTVIGGNCGFSVAPARTQRGRLPDAHARPRRGHAARDAGRRRATGTGPRSAPTSTGSRVAWRPTPGSWSATRRSAGW